MSRKTNTARRGPTQAPKDDTCKHCTGPIPEGENVYPHPKGGWICPGCTAR